MYPSYILAFSVTVDFVKSTYRLQAWVNKHGADCPRLDIILAGHSMGGLVIVDAVLSMHDEGDPLLNNVRGILAFDSPYVGLNRYSFFYGLDSLVRNLHIRATLTGWVRRARRISRGVLLCSAALVLIAAVLMNDTTGESGAISSSLSALSELLGEKLNPRIACDYIIALILSLIKYCLLKFKSNLWIILAIGLILAAVAICIFRSIILETIRSHYAFIECLFWGDRLHKRCSRLTRLQSMPSARLGAVNFYTKVPTTTLPEGRNTFCELPASCFSEDADMDAHDEDTYTMVWRPVSIRDAQMTIAAHVGMFKPETNYEYFVMLSRATEYVSSWIATREDLEYV